MAAHLPLRRAEAASSGGGHQHCHSPVHHLLQARRLCSLRPPGRLRDAQAPITAEALRFQDCAVPLPSCERSAQHPTTRAAAPKPSARACRLLQPLSTCLPEQDASPALLWCA